MSAAVALFCQCKPVDQACLETVLIEGVQTIADARGEAQDRGWYCEVRGGNTVDWAPGHREAA